VKRIKDLRTRRLGTAGVQRESSVEDAVREFLATDLRALVVYDGKKLVGIFTRNDLVRCVGDHPDGIRSIKVSDYMKTNLFTATIDDNLDDVMEVMVEKGFHQVPVLEGDYVIGMVASSDILLHQKSHLGSERDELVRYIQGS
jgi:CBS domain-containing protein